VVGMSAAIAAVDLLVVVGLGVVAELLVRHRLYAFRQRGEQLFASVRAATNRLPHAMHSISNFVRSIGITPAVLSLIEETPAPHGKPVDRYTALRKTRPHPPNPRP
jgi:hypothetical protein